VFDYGGRGDSSKPKFFSGKCAMTISSAAARLGIITNMKSDVGLALLPYYADARRTQNSIIGGASLWVLRARSRRLQRRGAVFAYLSKPDVQAWCISRRVTCRSPPPPRTLARQGFYDKNPAIDVAVKEINLNPRPRLQGLAARQFPADRALVEEEIENALQGKRRRAAGARRQRVARAMNCCASSKKSNS